METTKSATSSDDGLFPKKNGIPNRVRLIMNQQEQLKKNAF